MNDLPPERLRNRTHAELRVGDSAELTRQLGEADIALFATVSGDMNPAHMDPAFANSGRFGRVIGHGMWTASLISAVLGTRLPGPGTVYLRQDLRFLAPVAPGDTVTARVTVAGVDAQRPHARLDCVCFKADGTRVLEGVAEVLVPTESIERDAVDMPDVLVRRRDRFHPLLERARALPPLRMAVVHPCDPAAMEAVEQAREAGLIVPILIGPRARVEAAARQSGTSLDGIELIDTPHSHASAEEGARLAAQRRVDAIMKGSLHTDELLEAVVSSHGGLRTERRISHVYALDVPAYDRLLMVTDAAVNVAPCLAAKRDIAQNAIDLAHVLGIGEPKVAVLAAVETVNPKMPSTLDAAALAMMARRGQITGGIVDGPLAFDNAIDREAARTKGLDSPVAGQADILLVPDIEAGNMVAKQLLYFAGADGAGLVLGAKVPVILTSRADGVRVRVASVALASLLANAMRQQAAG